jgi:hypothetical protein
MKTRKRDALAVAFSLMALIAGPQIMFAQAAPTPTRGSWDGIKAIPPGDEVAVKIRNGQTLKGPLISVSDTVLTIARGKNTTDISRADALKVYRTTQKSATKSTMIGLGVGAGVGAAALGAAAAGSSADAGDYALGVLFIGGITGGIGALIGYLIGSRKQQILIYETR